MERFLLELKKDLKTRPLVWEDGEAAPVMDMLYGCYCESMPVVEKTDRDTCKRRAFEWGVRVGIALARELREIDGILL